MPFVSVVPIIVPLCSIYLWCNQNVFKRISQWINTIYSGKFNASTTNCSLGIFAKSLDGLPRAWVRIPPTPPLWQSALGEIRELFCFVKLFLAKCYSGLPRTGFALLTILNIHKLNLFRCQSIGYNDYIIKVKECVL